MLYQRKRKKIDLCNSNNKNNEDSTQNSEKIASTEKISSLSKNKKKSLTKTFNKRMFNQQISQTQLAKQRQSSLAAQNKIEIIKNQKKLNQNIDQRKLTNEFQKQLKQNQKIQTKSNTNSICSIQTSNLEQQQIKSNRKKFKLYCEVKKKKINHKNAQSEKEAQKTCVASTGSQSWNKNSLFSRVTQNNDCKSKSNSRNKVQRSSKRKIDLAQKIKKIKSKQKYQASSEAKTTPTNFQFDFKLQEALQARQRPQKETSTKRSDQNSKRSKNSQQKKESTVNIKRSLILQKLNSQKSSRRQQSPKSESYEQKQKILVKNNNYKYQKVENKILPDDSQIIEQSVKRLSQIKEQKNQDTISRSLKANQLNSIDYDHSNSKNNEQTCLHLSINSVCKDQRRFYGCVLQTTELQSSLRKSIESSLSQLQRTRQKINILKFEEPKTIGQMGSQISKVQQNMSIIEKIEFHIELINTLSNFVYKSTQLEYLMEDWDELNFLIYKKFYIQRTKVLHFLKKYPIKNPFCIKRASIQTKSILKTFKQKKQQIQKIKIKLESQNSTIKKNLEVFYAQFSPQQHGQKINLFEYDNFSHWIYKELWDQIQLFSYSRSHNKAELQDRICRSLQAGFLISQLNANYVTPFEDAQIATYQNKQKVYIDDNLRNFQIYVLNKKK